MLAAADHLTAAALRTGQPALAEWAAKQRLLVAPTSEDLMAVLLDAAATNPDRLATAWRDITRRLDANDDPIPDALLDRYHHLRERPISTSRDTPPATVRQQHEDISQ